MKKLSYVICFVMTVFLAFSFIGCSDDDNDYATVRVIHTSYDAPAVDVYVDGSRRFSGISYGDSSGYSSVAAGNRKITVTPANAVSPVVIGEFLTFGINQKWTIYAVDQLSNISAITSLDDQATISGNAKVRFVHASPDAPAVDIKLNSGSGPVVFQDVSFKDVEDYVIVSAGTYVFAVTPTGSATEVAVFDPITLQGDGIYTIVARGTLDATDSYNFTVRVFSDTGGGTSFEDLTEFGMAKVMVIHASPDAPGVDVLVDDGIVATNLTFPNNTGYLDLLATMHNVKVNVTGTDTTVIDQDFNLAKDTFYSVFAANEVSLIEPLAFVDTLTDPAAGNARVRFVHLSPDAPAVDVAVTGGAVIFANVSFKGSVDFTPIAAGTYDLEVRQAGTPTVVLPLPGVVLGNQKIYTIFANGFVTPAPGEPSLGAEIIVNK